jgi:maleylacetoacetate isomerase
MRLYTYFRSSAAYRVRIALNLKGLAYEAIPVHLLREGGEQKQARYKAMNPLGLVPTLETDSGVITQSMAMIEWLEEAYPERPLLPTNADARAQVRAIAQTIACDIHPLNNLRVLAYLNQELGVSDEKRAQWYRHWVQEGLEAVERLLLQSASHGSFCYGDTPTLADCCLVPQVFNAQRFHCALEGFCTIQKIVQNCNSMPAFRNAAPELQADAESN